MYLFKKFLGALLSPLTIAFVVALVGVALWLLNRRRGARIAFCCAGIFAWLIATPFVGSLLLTPLEYRYPVSSSYPPVEYVVVLGSSYSPREGVPVTAAIDEHGFRRAVEGLRLQRLIPGSRLVVSGGALTAGREPATGSALLVGSLGLPQQSIIRLTRPLDTRSEAAEIAALTRGAPFIVVTSASHMPRAMEYLRRAGSQPYAAPTGHRTHRRGFHPASLLPSSYGLRMSEEAIHEYLGWIALLFDVG